MTDILQDLEDRLKAIGFQDPKIERVVLEVRKDYQGERPYISMKYEKDRQISKRNRQLVADFKRGDSALILKRRYQLSKAQVYKILHDYDAIVHK